MRPRFCKDGLRMTFVWGLLLECLYVAFVQYWLLNQWRDGNFFRQTFSTVWNDIKRWEIGRMVPLLCGEHSLKLNVAKWHEDLERVLTGAAEIFNLNSGNETLHR